MPSTLYPPRTVAEAAPAAVSTITNIFPDAVVDTNFVSAVASELATVGLTNGNSIAIVNTCRDEICRPLVSFIDEAFGMSFNISGLGGLLNSGKTGFKAAMSHSPQTKVDGKVKEKYVFFAFPHISVDEHGHVGHILREGRSNISHACGALLAIQGEAKAKKAIVEDEDDAEYVLLKKKLFAHDLVKHAGEDGPDLVAVTKAALEVITKDLEKLISQTVNTETSDYAVVTGVQIHSGAQVDGEEFKLDRAIDYIAPGTLYSVVNGQKQVFTIKA